MAPWILFEAGALAKIKNARVCTLLLDIKKADVEPPPGQFQATLVEQEKELQESGMGWTILRPHHFTQNLLAQAKYIRKDGVVYRLPATARFRTSTFATSPRSPSSRSRSRRTVAEFAREHAPSSAVNSKRNAVEPALVSELARPKISEYEGRLR